MSKRKGGHARGQYTLAARLSLWQDTALMARKHSNLGS